MARTIGLRPRALHRLAGDGRGNTAVEFAFAAPALLMLLVGILQCGRVLWLQNALDYSVAEAARCASVDPSRCGTATQIESYAAGLSGAGFAASMFSASTPSCGNRVAASYPLALAIPFVSVSLTLAATACSPN
jgi:disulfide bond formation protein DsbB